MGAFPASPARFNDHDFHKELGQGRALGGDDLANAGGSGVGTSAVTAQSRSRRSPRKRGKPRPAATTARSDHRRCGAGLDRGQGYGAARPLPLAGIGHAAFLAPVHLHVGGVDVDAPSPSAAFAAGSGLEITVVHFPPGTSKRNRVEHRLFSYITTNWRARPLQSHEVVIETIAATTTRTGLAVRAMLDTGVYQTGIRISDKDMKAFEARHLHRHQFHGNWNYTVNASAEHIATRPESPN